jgi:hypothetical protein
MNIPRRIRVDLNTGTELAIRKAIHEVESLKADIRLTEASILLQQALNKVSDYIDEQLEKQMDS